MFFFFQFHLPLGIFPRNYLWAKDGVKTLGGHRTRWSLMLSLPGPDPPPFWASIMTTFSSFCHGSFFVVSTFKTNCRCKEMWGSQHSLPFNLEKEKKARCHIGLSKLASSACWLWLLTEEKPNKGGGGIYFSKQYLSNRKNSISSKREGLTAVTIRKPLQTTTWLKKTTCSNNRTAGFLWAFGGGGVGGCSGERTGRDALNIHLSEEDLQFQDWRAEDLYTQCI